LSGGGIDYDDLLQAKLANLEKEVKALRLQKRKLHQEPVEFRSVASETHMERTANSQKHFLQVESKLLLKKLMLQRLSGNYVVIIYLKLRLKTA